jgi:hypothetical protein
VSADELLVTGHTSVQETVDIYRLWPVAPAVVGAAATPHTAKVVLDVAGCSGHAGYGSDFDRQLCRAVLAADLGDRARLRLSFPAMVDAVNLYEQVGVEAVWVLAGEQGRA